MSLAPITPTMQALAREALWHRHPSTHAPQWITVVDPRSLRRHGMSLDGTVPDGESIVRVVQTCWQWQARGRAGRGQWICQNPLDEEAGHES